MPVNASRVFSLSAILLFLLLSLLTAARATSVVRFPFDSLCVAAERIVRVRCTDVSAERDPERGRIFTRVRFELLETIKGPSDPAAAPELLLPGGEVDGQQQFVPGMPIFRKGEETVLFLTAPSDDTGSPWPLGLYQGAYVVAVGEAGERQVQLRPGVTPLPQGAAFKPASNRPFRVGLDRFRSAVQDALQRAGTLIGTPAPD